jgi:hypothetical protein
VWRWNPFCGAVFAFSSAPAADFTTRCEWLASHGEVVDVSQSAVSSTFFGVMDLPAVAGHGATGMGAPDELDGAIPVRELNAQKL